MNEQDKKQAKKLLVFAENPQLAIFDELQEANKNLEDNNSLLVEIVNKETPEIPPFPQIPPFPEIPKLDMTETNNLLKKVIEKQGEKQKISVKLVIE